MAMTIQVPGPTVVQYILANTGTNWTNLGYSDNDNLPTIQFTDHQHEIKTALSGAVPEEIVMNGAEARIGVSLVKWDQTNFTSLLEFVRGGQDYSIPGTRVVGQANPRLISLRLNAADGSNWVFRNVYPQTEFMGDSQWGNRERVLTLAFRTLFIKNAETGVVTDPWVYTAAQ